MGTVNASSYMEKQEIAIVGIWFGIEKRFCSCHTDLTIAKQFIEAGADVILVPAVGTVPGFDMEELKAVVREVHRCGGLVLSAIGTSQESSDEDTIKEIAIMNKICGVDIQHIGDAGYGGVAPVENLLAISKAVRGVRHTVSMIARSINR